MIRLIPPVAVPVKPRQVASSLLAAPPSKERSFARALGRAIGREGVELFGSGRAALARYLARDPSPGRDQVLVPAYTCWSVPASVVRAGLRVRLVDVDPVTLDLDFASVDAAPASRLQAAISAHLFAPTGDVDELASRVRGRDPAVRIVEDAAQAWPPAGGSTADAVLLSFGRGKPLPLGTGGALLHDDGGTGGAEGDGGYGAALGLLLTSLLAHPGWYRIPESIPFLAIGATVYDPGFDPDRPFRRWQGRLGHELLARLGELQERRTRNARLLAERVVACPGWTVPAGAERRSPVRLPALAPSRQARDETVRALRRRGVAATAMYPGTLADIAALRPHLANPDVRLPGARQLAERLMTLPVYPTLSDDDVARIGEAFGQAVPRGVR